MNAPRTVAVAAATGRIGAVCLSGNRLMAWEISRKAAHSQKEAAAFAQAQIARFEPAMFVTEDPNLAKRKGTKTKQHIRAMLRAAANAELYDVAVERKRRQRNKYEEAQDIATRHPVILPLVPPVRRCWEPEPRQMVLFEAIWLAEEAIRQSGLPE